MTYVHGALAGDHVYKLLITPARREDTKHLSEALVQDDPGWKNLHELMRRLWEEPELDGPNTSHSTYLMALCQKLLHGRGTGNTAQLQLYSGVSTQFVCNMYVPASDMHPLLCSAVSAVIKDFLELDSLKPFSQICDLSTYTASLIVSQPQHPRVVWNPSMDIMSIDGEQVALDRLQEGLQNQLALFEHLILEITRGKGVPDWLASGPPLVDQPQEDTPGYSFLNDPCFLNTHLLLLR